MIKFNFEDLSKQISERTYRLYFPIYLQVEGSLPMVLMSVLGYRLEHYYISAIIAIIMYAVDCYQMQLHPIPKRELLLVGIMAMLISYKEIWAFFVRPKLSSFSSFCFDNFAEPELLCCRSVNSYISSKAHTRQLSTLAIEKALLTKMQQNLVVA